VGPPGQVVKNIEIVLGAVGKLWAEVDPAGGRELIKGQVRKAATWRH